MVAYSVLVGIVAGLGAYVFSHALEATSRLCLRDICGVELPQEGRHVEGDTQRLGEAPDPPAPPRGFTPPPWRRRLWIPLVPAVGGLLCGLLVFTFAPEAEGHGTDSVVDAFHRKRGAIRWRIPLIKTVASVLTIATGGNAGREGPIAQIGAGFGAFLADVLHLSARQRRMLVIAGIGAGVGSIFRAPLGGALFAVDVLYRDTEFEFESLMPAFIASIVGYTIYTWLTPAGHGPIFYIPAGLSAQSPVEVALCVLLAVVLAAVGVIYIKTFYGVTGLFRDRLRVPRHIKPMIGGLLLGAIAFADPRLLGTGYGWVQEAVYGNLTVRFMLTLIAAKIVLTSITVGSGGSGGVFGPSVVIGGLIGGAFGTICQRFVPSLDPAAFVLLGMAGFFSGAAKVPISTIIMVSEITVGYALLPPLMLVCSLTYLLAPRCISIYINQVPARVDSPAHLGDFVVDILERMDVRQILVRRSEYKTVSRGAPLLHVLEQVSQTRQSVFPVVDDEDLLAGIIRLDDLRGAFMQTELGGLVIAADIAVQRFEYLYLEDNLNVALRKLAEARCEELPVLSDKDSREVIGMLSRHELVQAYSISMETLMRGESAVAARAS